MAMNRDDIIRMARETKLFDLVDVDCKEVRDFVALVAAAEREACANVCDKLSDDDGPEGGYAYRCALQIRARWK